MKPKRKQEWNEKETEKTKGEGGIKKKKVRKGMKLMVTRKERKLERIGEWKDRR